MDMDRQDLNEYYIFFTYILEVNPETLEPKCSLDTFLKIPKKEIAKISTKLLFNPEVEDQSKKEYERNITYMKIRSRIQQGSSPVYSLRTTINMTREMLESILKQEFECKTLNKFLGKYCIKV